MPTDECTVFAAPETTDQKTAEPKKRPHKTVTLSRSVTVLSIIGICLADLLFTTLLQPGSAWRNIADLLSPAALLFLNVLPIVLFVLALYALIGNVFYAGTVSTLLTVILTLINRIKIERINSPFQVSDMLLVREAAEASVSYHMNLHIPYAIIALLFCAGLIILGAFFKSRRPKTVGRVILGIAAAGMLTGAILTLYSSKTVYNGLIEQTGVHGFNLPECFNRFGFPYSFLHTIHTERFDKPYGYSADEAAEWANEPPAASDGAVQANVIIVQCEGFSFLTDCDAFTYEETEAPLYLFRQVAQSDRAASGKAVVSDFGGATANMEFDVITGIRAYSAAHDQGIAFQNLMHPTPSLARQFIADGYTTYFLHPGQDWFYGRKEAYEQLGFETRQFDEVFTQADIKGNMISDEAFLNQLISAFEAHRAASDAPWFGFGVSIQNHTAYNYQKYDFAVDNVPLDREVTPEAMEALSVYALGVKDSSQMLYDLTQYLDTVDEPTLLLFYGDHQPSLGSDTSAYRQLGLEMGMFETAEQTLLSYETPYVIWVNEAYAAQHGFDAEALELPQDGRVSDFYLGAAIYNFLGHHGDPWWDYLNSLRQELPVVWRDEIVVPDGGTATFAPTDAQKALTHKLHCWEYYRLTTEVE